jgi:hypothetical protein
MRAMIAPRLSNLSRSIVSVRARRIETTCRFLRYAADMLVRRCLEAFRSAPLQLVPAAGLSFCGEPRRFAMSNMETISCNRFMPRTMSLGVGRPQSGGRLCQSILPRVRRQ